MIKAAIDAHPAFHGSKYVVYAKGSYANNTNVRLDSDVDVVVENRDCHYYDYIGDQPQPGTIEPYRGTWADPKEWRSEVTKAVVAKFGTTAVDTTGNVALRVVENAGTRTSADVVPSVLYYRYYDLAKSSSYQGSKVFKASSGSLVNWPQQQLDNGIKKNVDTGHRYKRFVRILKNAENELVRLGSITSKPSYLMECLVWNVPDKTLNSGSGGTTDVDFCETLRWLWLRLDKSFVGTEWTESNGLKYLFHSGQAWTVQDAKDVVLKAWGYFGYK
jgi:hypothetical protein